MPCHYCGKPIPITRRIKDPDFCSDEHRERYNELARAALRRLMEARPPVDRDRAGISLGPEPSPAHPAEIPPMPPEPARAEQPEPQDVVETLPEAAPSDWQPPPPAPALMLSMPAPIRGVARFNGPSTPRHAISVLLPRPSVPFRLRARVAEAAALAILPAARASGAVETAAAESRWTAVRPVFPHSSHVIAALPVLPRHRGIPMPLPRPAAAIARPIAAGPTLSATSLRWPGEPAPPAGLSLAVAAPVAFPGPVAVSRLPPACSTAAGLPLQTSVAALYPARIAQVPIAAEPLLSLAGIRPLPEPVAADFAAPGPARMQAAVAFALPLQAPGKELLKRAAPPRAAILPVAPRPACLDGVPREAPVHEGSDRARLAPRRAASLLGAVLGPVPILPVIPRPVTLEMAVQESPRAWLGAIAAWPRVELRSHAKLGAAGCKPLSGIAPSGTPPPAVSHDPAFAGKTVKPLPLRRAIPSHAVVPLGSATALLPAHPSVRSVGPVGREDYLAAASRIEAGRIRAGLAPMARLHLAPRTPAPLEPARSAGLDRQAAARPEHFSLQTLRPQRRPPTAPRAMRIAPFIALAHRPASGGLAGPAEPSQPGSFTLSAPIPAWGSPGWPVPQLGALAQARPVALHWPAPARVAVGAHLGMPLLETHTPGTGVRGLQRASLLIAPSPLGIAGCVSLTGPVPLRPLAAPVIADWRLGPRIKEPRRDPELIGLRKLTEAGALAAGSLVAARRIAAAWSAAAPAVADLAPVGRLSSGRSAVTSSYSLAPQRVAFEPPCPVREARLEESRACVEPLGPSPAFPRSGFWARATCSLPHLPVLSPVPRPQLGAAGGIPAAQEPRWGTRARAPRASNTILTVRFELPPTPPVWVHLIQIWRGLPALLRATVALLTLCTGLGLFIWAVAGDAIGTQLQKRAAVRLEENFQRGFAAWLGPTDWMGTWNRTASGYVEVGRLALWRPSRRLSDYQFEFLAQMGNRGLGWVFRAADPENYYAMRLVIAKPGPLPSVVLLRTTVVAGREQQRVQVPVRARVQQATPLRVRMLVRGDAFTTWIADQLVDFWRDDRFREGGIGFFAEPGDRAQLYWVRLTHQDDFLGKLCAYLAPSQREDNSR